MATQNPVIVTFEAGASLASDQFKFVKLSSGKVVICSAAGDAAIGVLQNNPASGGAASVCVFGFTKVKAGASLAVDALVKSDSAAKAVAAAKSVTNTSDAGAASDPLIGSYVLGQVTKGVSNADEVAEMFFHPVGAVATTAA